MKTILTILLLCSVAVGQQAAANQSSKHMERSAVGKAAHAAMVKDGWTTTGTAITWPEYTSFTVNGSGGKLMVSIDTKTGAVTFGKDYDLDETAKTFWIALGHKMASCTDGAHGETSGKPDSEKPEKKLP